MANVDAEVVFCANPDCRVAETGRCVEGFELGVCPHYGRGAGEGGEGEPSGKGKPVEREGDSTRLAAAETLELSEASRLLRAGEGRVIAILGPTASGKTSLIASLYDLFQEGAVGGVEFSGSQTLHAFERTCHDARMGSRRGEPHMSCTPRGEVQFYHLEVGGGIARDGLSLIVGDRAGEEYLEAADDASVATAFSEVVRANSLTVLVDGERLLDAGARHNLSSEIKLILQALRDGGAMRAGSRLALVLTKLDAVRESPHSERAARDFDRLFVDLRRLFRDVLSTVEQFQIAAAPKTVALPRGTGIPELLSFWLQQAVAPAKHDRPPPQFDRAFARLLPVNESAE